MLPFVDLLVWWRSAGEYITCSSYFSSGGTGDFLSEMHKSISKVYRRSPVDDVAGRSSTMRCFFFPMVSCFQHWTSGFCCCTWITLAVLCGNTWIALRTTWKMPCLAVSALLSHASLSSLVLTHVCWRYLLRRTDSGFTAFSVLGYF